MKLLIVGGGGREHALAWKAAQSSMVDLVYVAPGNAGTELEPGIANLAIDAGDIDALLGFARVNKIGLTIVGPEAPLVAGIVDRFEAAGLKIFGPSAAAARLEGSKTFTKDFLARHQIPSAAYQSFTGVDAACDYVARQGTPIVIKADGLAAGKGVIIAQSHAEAEQAIKDMLAGNRFGEAGHRVVVEEFLDGEEASYICIVDGEQVLPMASSQDHKARDNGDLGPNTGGMGAYSPAPVLSDAIEAQVLRDIIQPTVTGMNAEGNRYRGFLYAGLMIGADGIARVLEYNCRFGDPETQPIMMRLRSDLVELCLNACDGELDGKSAQWDDRASLGVVMAARGYPDGYARGESIENIPPESAAGKVFHAGTRLDARGRILSNGGRVLCVVGLGDDIASAQRQAYEILAKIHWESAYFRTDIGFKAL
ncbi:MAG: phosphoribosylamine--glycine ligase [Gammaproteobacteria bacterium]|nr:phosphoribosylamine--glycine ligase [Gammaproteobacteria bacterium]MDH3534752.1 phosphoribosylamine--glycine ligase [Gammaproteobacteria bacterium]